jgi:hypothetical protein
VLGAEVVFLCKATSALRGGSNVSQCLRKQRPCDTVINAAAKASNTAGGTAPKSFAHTSMNWVAHTADCYC